MLIIAVCGMMCICLNVLHLYIDTCIYATQVFVIIANKSFTHYGGILVPSSYENRSNQHHPHF